MFSGRTAPVTPIAIEWLMYVLGDIHILDLGESRPWSMRQQHCYRYTLVPGVQVPILPLATRVLHNVGGCATVQRRWVDPEDPIKVEKLHR